MRKFFCASSKINQKLKMKKVIIIAPQFPPCNLTAAHRSRYFASYLSKFGWETKVLTVKPYYYQGRFDQELTKLLPVSLEIIRTKALPQKLLGLIGDIGLRSVWQYYRELNKIIKKEKINLIYIPIPPNYSAILGPIIYKKFGVPYGIDYIDPWINNKIYYKPFSKGWWADKLGRILEPIVLRHVSFITAVAPGYYQKALLRYRWLDKNICFSLPYGAEEKEYQYLSENPRPTFLFSPCSDKFHIVYAGAMLPKAYPVLEALMRALIFLKKENKNLYQKIKLHFLGTGKNPFNSQSFSIKPLALKYNLSDVIVEYPARIPYLDTLNHLKHSGAVLILGSTEQHYTPSKVFQAILSRKPVLAILHEQSSAVKMLKEIGVGEIVIFKNKSYLTEKINTINECLIKIIGRESQKKQINREALKAYSAEMMAKKLAEVFDRSLK